MSFVISWLAAANSSQSLEHRMYHVSELAQVCTYVPLYWTNLKPIEQVASVSGDFLVRWVDEWMKMMAALIVTDEKWRCRLAAQGHRQAVRDAATIFREFKLLKRSPDTYLALATPQKWLCGPRLGVGW